MYILMLWVDGIPQPFGLRFTDGVKCAEIATGIKAANPGTVVDVEDAYGSALSVARTLIKVVHVLPVEGDLDAQSEIQMIQQRAQAKLQGRVGAMAGLMNGAGMGGLVRPPN